MYTIFCPPFRSGRGKCTAEITQKGLNEEGMRVARERAEAQLDLLDEITGELEEVSAVFYSHDVPWQFVGHEYVSGGGITILYLVCWRRLTM
jgi:hypothetical protein